MMDIRANDALLIISVENYTTNDVEFDGTLPKTSKHDTNLHGYGLKSIKYITEKYNGVMKVSAKNHIFYLSILFRLPQESGNQNQENNRD